MIPIDKREEIIHDLDLEPHYGGQTEDGLTIFKPKEAKKPEPQLVLVDSVAGYDVWQRLTPVQRLVAQRVVVEQEGFFDVAKELSDEFVKVHPDDVELAHRCACDVVRSVAVQC